MRVRRPTSFDIAALAGVSQSTVSRALRQGTMVAEDTRAKVAEAARRLHYKVDVNARNLRAGSTRTLALLLREDPVTSQSLINPFFLSMLSSITKACGRRGLDLLISFQQPNPETSLDSGIANRADGIIFLGYGDYLGYLAEIARLDEAEAHYVTWGPVIPGQPGHFIGSDNEQGAYEITSHLLRNGRRRIAFLGDISDHCPEFRDRYQGYRRALAQAGIAVDPALQIDAQATEAAGSAAISQLLTRGAGFDAVFATCDLIAIGALNTLRQAGMNVPGRIALVGFDDIQAASCTDPPLTTVRQNTVAAGELLVDNLLRLIDGQPITSSIVPTELVVRRSCGVYRHPIAVTSAS